MSVLPVDCDDTCNSAVAGKKMPSTSEGKTQGAKAGVGD
jgi:hypothetical protein